MEEECSDSLNFHPDEIPVGDLLLDPYDIPIEELINSEGEGEEDVKPRLVCDEMTGPQVDNKACSSHHQILLVSASDSVLVELSKISPNTETVMLSNHRRWSIWRPRLLR